ncbi:MAG: peptidylprolyl isomerase [candidate division WOR-3 bacterium]
MQIEKDKVVTFHYVLKDKETGEVIDSSRDYGEPVKVLFGRNLIIEGLERGMMGMKEGETRVIEVKAEDAYGEVDPNLIQKVPREYFGDLELEKGMPLRAQTPDGQFIDMVVVDFDEENVIVDLNHPLAGKDLVFEVEVINVRDATPEELEHGHAH